MKKMSTNEIRNNRRRNRSKRNNVAHPNRPRLVVYRSNKHISAQVIDDHNGKTLASASSLDKIIEKSVSKAKSKIEVSTLVGTTLAERAKKNKVKEVVIDKLGVDEAAITEKAHFVNDLGADSLDTVELIMEFEEEFGIEIPDEDAENITTVNSAVKYIDEHK